MTNEVLKRAAEQERKLRQQLRELSSARKRISGGGGNAYQDHRERAAARQSQLSESGRDIGDLPAIVNPVRRAAAETDFRVFCESYLPESFRLAWSDDHLRAIAKI